MYRGLNDTKHFCTQSCGAEPDTMGYHTGQSCGVELDPETVNIRKHCFHTLRACKQTIELINTLSGLKLLNITTHVSGAVQNLHLHLRPNTRYASIAETAHDQW